MVMSSMETLPNEIIQHIAELCTWDSKPPEEGFPSEIDAERYCWGDEWQPATYARYHASLARTSRHFYNILNKGLYTRNQTRDPSVFSCLRWAVKRDRLQTLQLAHQYGADLSSYGPYPDVDASHNGEVQLYEYIKVNGCLVPFNSRINKLGSPLHDAASLGLNDIAEFLLKAGVDVDTRGPEMGTKGYPLALALQHGHLELASMLVRHGAYLVAEGFSAILVAHAAGSTDIVQTLLQRNDPVSVVGKLHLGAATNNLELVTYALKEAKVDINAEDWTANTALHLAVKSARDDLDVINFLLQQPGIKSSIYDTDGLLPLHSAAWNGQRDVVRLLMELPDADATCRTRSDETVLHMAAKTASIGTFDYFLQHPSIEYPEGELDRDAIVGYACRVSDDERAMAFVQFLVNSGFPPQPKRATLMAAITTGNIQTALSLVRLMSDEELRGHDEFLPRAQTTSIHQALLEPRDHQTALVRELIARGIDLEFAGGEIIDNRRVRMKFIATPLYHATAFARNKDCMKILLESGASASTIVNVRGSRSAREKNPSMSFLTGILSYIWRAAHFVECRIHHPYGKQIPAEEDMHELKDRILILLQYGATLNKVGTCSSALRLICVEAEYSLSWGLLEWVAANATEKNVDIEHVDSLLDEFPPSEDDAGRRKTRSILTVLRERLMQEG